MSMLRSLWPRGKRKRSHLEDKMDFSECKSAEAVDMESLRSDFTASLEKAVIFSAENTPQGSRNSSKTLRSAETYEVCGSEF